MDKLISIIIPVYNAEKYLGECIDSVIKQSYQNWELILVNDGSTDCSKEICTEYANRDDRILVFHNENHGVSYTRNFGINAAKGEYLCFIDADDKILPDYLSELLNQMTQNEVDIVYCGYQLLYDDKLVKKQARLKKGVYRFEDLAYRAIDDGTLTGILFGSVCGALYRHSLITEKNISFDSTIHKNEDGLFNLELLPHTRGIAISEYTGYLYRQWVSANRQRTEKKINNELNIVSDAIAQRCHFYDQLDKQLRCRELSIIFWNMQKITKYHKSIFAMSKELKAYVLSTNLHKFYPDLNFSALNRYKKILMNLVYRKHYFLFIVLIKYVKPFLEKRLKH